jgi:hypothetical protein
VVLCKNISQIARRWPNSVAETCSYKYNKTPVKIVLVVLMLDTHIIYISVGVHYRKNNGVSSKLAPVSIVTLWIQMVMTNCCWEQWTVVEHGPRCEQLRFGSDFVCHSMGTVRYIASLLVLLFVPENDSGRTGEIYRLVIWICSWS